jgi:K+-sensing histidine kinase KdpD
MILGEGSVFIFILLLGLYKIRRSIKKEFELSGRQSNFLLSITHELKTPIASSKLLLQTLLKRELIQEKRNELITKTLNENERLENLIDNILNASRVENNALQAVKTEINLAELSIKIIKRLSLKSVTSQIQGNTIVKGDVFMLETIIENLIENAVKYSGTNPCITLYSFQNEKEIVFGVKDQGPGIPLTERENIFCIIYGNIQNFTKRWHFRSFDKIIY